LRPGSYDNSFKEKLLSYPFIDLMIFAGTPEWGSGRLKIFYEYAERHSVPVVYLRIGLGSADFGFADLDEAYKAVVRRALLITVRDQAVA